LEEGCHLWATDHAVGAYAEHAPGGYREWILVDVQDASVEQ